LRHQASQRQQQGQGVLGDAGGVAAGGIHHQDAAARGGVEVDIIHAHSGAADHAQPRRLLEQFVGHAGRAAHH